VTSLLDRITGTGGDFEERPLSNLPFTPPVPGTSAIPWWTGVPGLDPDVRNTDWRVAARCSAMACAAQVFGLDAGRPRIIRGAPVRRWVGWLLEAGEDTECRMRILALRLVCERAAGADPDVVLQAAQEIYAATLR